jgi:predicted Zn-dependent protease
MIELATMSPADRARSQIERLRVDVRQHPGDAELQLELAGLLLGEGRTEEALAAYRELFSANAAPAVWQRAGTALIRAGQYQLAKVFLERATADIPAARLDLAIARLFTAGPAEALGAIDQVPEAERQGDYWLMKARILEAAGRNVEAEEILARELSGSASRPEVIVEAARLLFRHNRAGEAVTMLSQAVKSNPGNSDLLLEQAAISALAGDGPGADRLLRQIEIRWPEWSRAWLVHGLVLEKLGQPRAALQKLQTAAALGGNDTLTPCALAHLSGKSAGPECACAERLAHWVLPSCR